MHETPRIILDTNALLMPFQFKINLDMEIQRVAGYIEVCVPRSVINELKKLKTKYRDAALKLAKKYKIIETELRGDKAIIEIVSEGDYVVTNDENLMKKLRKKKVHIIFLREKKHLEVKFER